MDGLVALDAPVRDGLDGDVADDPRVSRAISGLAVDVERVRGVGGRRGVDLHAVEVDARVVLRVGHRGDRAPGLLLTDPAGREEAEAGHGGGRSGSSRTTETPSTWG